MKKIATTIFSLLLLASVASAQQVRICPYTGQPYVVQNSGPVAYPQTTQYSPPVFDQQKMQQQAIQRAQMQAQHQLQRDQMMIQQRIQMAQMEFNFRQPTPPQEAQMFQQQLQQMQQELQAIQQRYNSEVARINQMR